MKNEIITYLFILAFSISLTLNILLYHISKIHKMWSEKFRDVLTKEIAKGKVDAEALINLLWGSRE